MANVCVVMLGASFLLTACSGGTAGLSQAEVPGARPGAAVLAPDYRGFAPSLAAARNDNPSVYKLGCHANFDDVLPKPCRFGPENAAVTVALVGDSHAAQWVPPLHALADRLGFRLVTYTKSSCPFSLATNLKKDKAHTPYTECDAWNRNVLGELLRTKPQLVVASQSRFSPVLAPRATQRLNVMADGLAKAWQQLLARHIRVLAIQDTPRPAGKIPECLATYGPQAVRCHATRASGVPSAERDPLVLAARKVPGAQVISMADSICDPFDCAPIVGGVIVWRDSNHLTATYARSLAPMLGEHVEAALASQPR